MAKNRQFFQGYEPMMVQSLDKKPDDGPDLVECRDASVSPKSREDEELDRPPHASWPPKKQLPIDDIIF
ncbi:hypothetical protein ACLOJK_031543 [Asimina triloba]